jgi:hypothetical protein
VSITTSQYQQLLWARDNFKPETAPIFMFNDLDQYAGQLAQLYDNWVSAVVGNHLSYLGLTDYLVQLEETPFANPVARATSATFMQQIRDSGITNRTDLLQHRIILIGEFYKPFPLPSYTSGLFIQVAPRVFVDDPAALGTLSTLTVPLYTSFVEHSGSWGGVNASWAMSGQAYEVYHDTGPMSIEATYYINVAQEGTYSLSLRYWDQTGNNLTITLDSNKIGTIHYDDAKLPVVQQFNQIPLTAGTHTFAITIEQTPYNLQWASIDYLELTKT